MDAARKRALLIHGGALAAYLVVALVYTFPLVARLASYVPSPPKDQDVFMFLWNNWWIHHAVTELHVKPYLTDFIAAPFTIDLRLGTLGLLYGLVSIPLFSVLGPVMVLNLQVMATATLNGYAAFRLTGYLAKDDRVGFVCGLFVAATPAINFHLGVGRPSCAALWPVILTMYLFLRLLDRPDNRTAISLGISSIAALLADQQAMMFGSFWLLILAIHAAATRRHDVLNRRFLVRLAAVMLVAAVPTYVMYVRPFLRTTGYTVPSPLEAYGYSYPVSLLWTPSMLWRAYGLVLPLALLASLALVRRAPGMAVWAFGAIVFIVLSFGPVATGTKVPLLFSLVRKLPAFAQFRAPYRFQIPAAIGLAAGAAVALSWLLPKLTARSGRLVLIGMAILAAGDLVAFRAAHGFEMQTMARDPVYDLIARDARALLVLEVPVGVRTGTDRIGPGEALSFHQSVHRKRLVNGSTSRLPLAALEYYRSSPAIMFLAGETPPPGDLAADLERRMTELKVGYVVVHPSMLNRERLAAVMELLQGARGLERQEVASSLIVYRRSAP